MFNFYLPIQIIYGVGSLNVLGTVARGINQKAMIITYHNINRVGLLDRVLNILSKSGTSVLIFDEVEPNPRATTIDKAAKIARDNKIELIIGLGGGSSMDAAKAVAITSSGTNPVWSYVNNPNINLTGPVPQIIQVPTMAGTGSELNSGAVITNWDTRVKSPLGHVSLYAKAAIIDPAITITVPKKYTAAGGLDTFCHSMEPYVVEHTPSPITDGIRETVMKTVVTYLPQTLSHLDNVEFRNYLSIASSTALSIGHWGGGSYTSICHGLEHALSGYYDVTHGEGLAALLPAFIRTYYPLEKARFDKFGKSVFNSNDPLKAVEDWLRDINMSFRLRDFGFELDRVNEIAQLAIESRPKLVNQGPIKLDIEKIAKLYTDSY